MARYPSTGVGAVAGARDEITIADGRLIISYGSTEAAPAADAETAALPATGKIDAWQSIRIDADVAPPDVEAVLAQSARAHGLDPDKSFPFQLLGTVAPYVMHVNAAPIDGPHGMGLPMAVTVVRKGNEIVGAVAGLHVSTALVGTVTHGGERVHAHWVSPDGGSTAHLDLWGIKAGTTFIDASEAAVIVSLSLLAHQAGPDLVGHRLGAKRRSAGAMRKRKMKRPRRGNARGLGGRTGVWEGNGNARRVNAARILPVRH